MTAHVTKPIYLAAVPDDEFKFPSERDGHYHSAVTYGQPWWPSHSYMIVSYMMSAQEGQ